MLLFLESNNEGFDSAEEFSDIVSLDSSGSELNPGGRNAETSSNLSTMSTK